jgi:hypothetical protein
MLPDRDGEHIVELGSSNRAHPVSRIHIERSVSDALAQFERAVSDIECVTVSSREGFQQ